MLTRDLDQWSSEAIRGVEQQPLEARFEEVGRTELVGDGIALVSGLPRLQLGELDVGEPKARDLFEQFAGLVAVAAQHDLDVQPPVSQLAGQRHHLAKALLAAIGDALRNRDREGDHAT